MAMDYSRPRGADLREVADRYHQGQPARVVGASRIYKTDRRDLWDAFTNPERIPKWFLPISGDLKRGGRYQLEGNADGTIIRCDVPEALDVTWEFGGHMSWVTVRLAPDSGGTRLTLEHIMPKDDAGEEHWKQFGPGATGVGWDLSFLGMALHLESGGEAIDREANDAWMASDVGKAFVRDSADAWCAAHIAAGENPQTARAMAARTGAAYMGE